MRLEQTQHGNTAELPALLQAVLPIYAVTPFTMLDFPGKTACIIWFSGCTMRCPYCHNPPIVKGKGRGDITDVMTFLKKRQGLLDGVVLSGGEATSYPDIVNLMRTIKSLGFAIKLDTNGLRPDRVRMALDAGLIDFIALDYKAPPAKFERVTGSHKWAAFLDTLDLLCTQTHIPCEIRTTVHTGLLDEADIQWIMDDLTARKFSGVYAIQNFRSDNNRPTLGSLPVQPNILDRTRLDTHDLRITFRNF